MLQVVALEKSFGSNKAVDGVSFEIAKGSCFGLLGPNGAGKSTTISMIVGTLQADRGEVLIEGTSVKSETDEIRRRIGYVPQELALYEDLTARANLRFFGSLYGRVDRVDACLEIVGLLDKSEECVRTYSGGMKRRLNIAVALLHDPELLILDEPTVGVDPQSRNAIFESLEGLRRGGMTILYTTHYMEEVERLCDRIAIMDHGKVVANDTLQGLFRLLPSENALTIDFESDDLVAKAEAILENSGVISAHHHEGTNLSLVLKDFSQGIAAVTASLAAAGIEYESLSTKKATLEEVFLHTTGRSLRD